jgi:DNA-binding Lrp family transcriptional regulator
MRILDEQEKAIVRRLIRDPRESDNGVGELTGVNVRTVSRKRQRLEQEGILSYYANVDLSANGSRIEITKQLVKMPSNRNPNIEHVGTSCVLTFEGCNAICTCLEQFDHRVELGEESIMCGTRCEVWNEPLGLNELSTGQKN